MNIFLFQGIVLLLFCMKQEQDVCRDSFIVLTFSWFIFRQKDVDVVCK